MTKPTPKPRRVERRLDAAEFIRALLVAEPGAHAWVTDFPTYAAAKTDDWEGALFKDDDALRGNAFYSIAVFPPTATSRSKDQALGVAVIVCDDVGKKASADDIRSVLGKPSFVIETSPGNQQWGYLLRRLATVEETDAIHAAMVARHLTDPSGMNAVRYARLAGGVNDKPEYGEPQPVRCLAWNPVRRFDPDELMHRLETNAADASKPSQRAPSDDLRQKILTGQSFHDPLVQLAARYLVRGNSEDDTVYILRGLMNDSEGRGSARWRARIDDIERIVHSAVAKKINEKGQPVDILAAPVAPAFSADDVPPVIGGWATLWADAAGFDPSAAIGSALVAAASMIDDGIQLEVAHNTRWVESARLWVALIAPPGYAKTPAIRAALEPVHEVHRRLVESYHPLPDAEERQPRPAALTNDATVEKLREVLQDNPRGIIYIAEELDSWLGAHDAYRAAGASKDRGEWLQLFDGGPHQVDRVKAGSYFVPNWGVSLLSATTPAALKKLVRKLPNDGLLQRFIPVMVSPAAAPDASIKTEKHYAAYHLALVKLYEHGTGRVKLGDEAAQLFLAEQLRLRDLAPACGYISESFAGHVAKYGSLLARVALTFHALAAPSANPADKVIASETVELATRFMRKAFLHARVFYRELGGADQAFDLAQRVARYILASRLKEVQRRDLTGGQPHFRDAGEQTQSQAMQILEDFGWVKAVDGKYRKAHVTRWVIDERVHILFAEYGEAHRKLREVVKAAIADGATEP